MLSIIKSLSEEVLRNFDNQDNQIYKYKDEIKELNIIGLNDIYIYNNFELIDKEKIEPFIGKIDFTDPNLKIKLL